MNCSPEHKAAEEACRIDTNVEVDTTNGCEAEKDSDNAERIAVSNDALGNKNDVKELVVWVEAHCAFTEDPNNPAEVILSPTEMLTA